MPQDQSPLADDRRNTIERTCIGLLTRFYFALDARDYDAAIQFFAPDGTWIRFGEHLAGHAALLTKMHQRPTHVAVRHVLSNLHVTALDADRAHTRGYATVYAHPYVGEAKDPAPIALDSLLLLDTSYVRTADGWRIRTHDGIFVMNKGAAPQV